MSALTRPDLPPGPLRDLNHALHELHHTAGWPSLRTLAKAAGCSPTTVSKVFTSPTLPSWGTLELLVEELDGDTTHFHQLWLAASTPTNGTSPAAPRIAGRRAELAAVRRHLETGTGLLLITGEAGIGKTTLLTAATADTDVHVARGHCLPLSASVPFMPVVELISDLAAVDDGQWVKEALTTAPPYVRGSLARLVPDLFDGPAPTEVDDFARQHLLASVTRCLRSAAELRPLAVLLEDLHWSDLATLDLLEHQLTRSGAPAVVGTWRLDDPTIGDEELDWRARIERLPSTRVLELHPLTEDETTEQLTLLLGATPDAEHRHSVYTRSLGNPLFTEHLTVVGGGTGRGSDRLPEVLDRRLERIGRSASDLACVLGVADRSLPLRVLGAVAGQDEDELRASLRELNDHHLVASDDAGRVQLRHPLLAEAARRRAAPGEAVAWHRSLARALSDDAGVDPAEVAEHWRAADDAEAELRWRVTAARAAHARTAPAAEAEQWTRALELHDQHPSPEFDELSARIAAFDACELSGRLRRAADIVAAALPRIDETDDFTAAALLRRAAMWEQWLNDDHLTGLTLVDRALERLRPHGVSEELVHVLDQRASLLIDLGRVDEVLPVLETALAVCDELGDAGLYFGTSATLGWQLAYLGDLGGALRVFAAARERVPGSAGPRREAYMGMLHSDALILHRRPTEEVVRAAEPAIRAGLEWDMDFHLLTVTRANVADAYFKAGQIRKAAAIVADLPVSDRYDHWPVTWMSAKVAIAEGRFEDALSAFESLELTGATPENVLNRTHWIAVAQVWRGRPDLALTDLRAALEAALGGSIMQEAGDTFVVLARAAADLAPRDPSQAAALGRSLRQLRRDAAVDPLGPAPAPVIRRATTPQWEAELARLDRVDTVDQWAVAATAWDGLRAPHDAAYCRWRAAQAALRAEQRPLAARLLKRAAVDAREHVPLTDAVAKTSAYAQAREHRA